jgi:CheY-like chemotaxis protein
MEMLVRWGMRPTPAADGKAALEELRAACSAGQAFQLILLDQHIPEMDGLMVAKRLNQSPDLGHPKIILLTAGGSAVEADEQGISGLLTKPVLKAELLEAIGIALGAPTELAAPVLTCHADGDTDQQPLRILLAEDNPVSQLLAVRLIEKRGHKVLVADNGREALSMILQDRFDIVLLDVQMPEMDGFSVARAAREREKDTREHLPIIALTANSMDGDRERCLAAGMDDYVSKPINFTELFDTIERCMSIDRTLPRSRTPLSLCR